MIELNEKQLKTLQKVELEILIEIDRICRKNHIRYSLTGGTLLGAVRHGGFIPWDDDADISMLRSQYLKFRRACEKDLDHSRFYFQDIDTTEGYRWGYGKIRRRGSLFLREYQEEMPYEQGIFVDIFPRDGVPDGFFERNIHKVVCFSLRKMLWSEVGKDIPGNIVKKIIYAILARIPLRIEKKIYHRLIQWSNRRRTQYVRALTFPLPNQLQGYKREWYLQYTNLMFENHLFMAEASYQVWLSMEFGDYMTLPDKSKRKSHPVSVIKFPEEYGI